MNDLSPIANAVKAAAIVGIMTIYGCGGGGINQASRFAQAKPLDGLATIKSVFIDTSASNLNGMIDRSATYILPDLDGSGKVRKENHEVISQEVPRILQAHPPTDFNVVIFTASGGTGSVAGPLLVMELLKRGQNVVAIVTGSDESAITATNTFNTLKSLDHIARSLNEPVIMHYSSNNRNAKRSEIDQKALFVAGGLAALASRQNKEMDSKDVYHFTHYNKATAIPAQLVMLNIHTDASKVDEQSKDAFAMAALLKNEDEQQPQLRPAYSTAGYYQADNQTAYNLFFCLETTGLTPILKDLEATAKSLEEQARAARIEAPAFKTEKDQVSSTGLIL